MPRVNYGKSREQLEREAQERHTQNIMRIIRTQMGAKQISRHDLADMCGLEYDKLGRILRGAIVLSVWDATKIADALKLNAEQRAAIIGGKAGR